MSRVPQRAATIAGIVVLGLPVTFVLTMMLVPLWSAMERRWGIESVGHSGPALWCYGAVLACVVAISVGAYAIRLSRPTTPSDEGAQP
ncbi:MAG TPA: hypothetical protein VFS59_00590 [Gemmatimonadaceae bacterium]|nr:hypothetical protein [Gemmatimonadaceae bacterium]